MAEQKDKWSLIPGNHKKTTLPTLVFFLYRGNNDSIISYAPSKTSNPHIFSQIISESQDNRNIVYMGIVLGILTSLAHEFIIT